jgi:hypothetical protein
MNMNSKQTNNTWIIENEKDHKKASKNKNGATSYSFK